MPRRRGYNGLTIMTRRPDHAKAGGPGSHRDRGSPGALRSHGQETGYNIILRACRAPLTQIADNAGADGSVICEKVRELEGNKGYNAATGEFEDLVKAGIIDPTKVTRIALQNAASVSTLLLTSDALIAEIPKDGHPGGDESIY